MSFNFLKRKITKSIIIILSAIFFFLLIFGIGIYRFRWAGKLAYSVSRVIPYPAIIVNSDIIPFNVYSDDYRALERYWAYQKNNLNVLLEIQDKITIRENLINKLIEEKIVERFAKSNGIKVEEKEKDTEWSKMNSSFSSSDEIDKFLTEAYGWSKEKFKERVLIPYLLREKVKNFLVQESKSDDVNLKQKANEIYLLAVEDGSDFSYLAKEYSEDTYSSENGGDLGYFERGTMDPFFEEAVFSMEIGEISEPVKSSFGYHIIKLEDLLYNDEDVPAQARARHILIKGFDFDEWMENQKSQASIYRLVY